LDPVEKAIQDLQDPDVAIRREAAKDLFDLNDTRAVEPLIEALSDEDAKVREEASAALEKLGEKEISIRSNIDQITTLIISQPTIVGAPDSSITCSAISSSHPDACG